MHLCSAILRGIVRAAGLTGCLRCHDLPPRFPAWPRLAAASRAEATLGFGRDGLPGRLHALQCVYRRVSDPYPGIRDDRSRGQVRQRGMHLLRQMHGGLRARRPAADGWATVVGQGNHRTRMPRPGQRGVPYLRRRLPGGGDPLSSSIGWRGPAGGHPGIMHRLRGLRGSLPGPRNRGWLTGGRSAKHREQFPFLGVDFRPEQVVSLGQHERRE